MVVLILGGADDEHVVHVQEHLRRAEARAELLDSRLFPHQIQLAYDPAANTGSIVLPDGNRIGVPSSDTTARILHVDTGRQQTFRGHRAEANSTTFSPDGRWMATASDDGTVRIWDADTGKPGWHCPALLPGPPRLLSHRGWIHLASAEKSRSTMGVAWQQAVEMRAHSASQTAPGGILCVVDVKRFSRFKFEVYRWSAWIRGKRTGDVHPGFSRDRLQQSLRRVGFEEDHYEDLSSTWRLGFNRVQPFLLRARRASS